MILTNTSGYPIEITVIDKEIIQPIDIIGRGKECFAFHKIEEKDPNIELIYIFFKSQRGSINW